MNAMAALLATASLFAAQDAAQPAPLPPQAGCCAVLDPTRTHLIVSPAGPGAAQYSGQVAFTGEFPFQIQTEWDDGSVRDFFPQFNEPTPCNPEGDRGFGIEPRRIELTPGVHFLTLRVWDCATDTEPEIEIRRKVEVE